MDELLPEHIDSDGFVSSSSDPVLPISNALPEFNTPTGYYHHHHRSDQHELVDGFSRLQLSPPSLLSPPPSSIPSSSSFRPRSQLWNIPSREYGFLLDTDIYSTPQPRWDSEFLMPPRSPRVNVMRGNTASIANNPTWCNSVKDLVSKGRPEDIARSFSVVSKNTAAVMVDLYGSSLFQKLLDVCSPRQRSELFDATVADLNRLLNICCSDYGTMAMRKLLYYCHTRNQIWRLMHALRPYLLDLAKHEHGNRIVERCLSHFSSPTEKALLDPLFNNWEDLAKHKFGCYILQQALDLVPKEDRNHVLAKIANNVLDLARDSSGNYLMQYVLNKRIPYITYQILRRLDGNFVSLSIQKYSSNVVEECLKHTEEAESTKIINELLQSPNVLEILEDRYGNYVIQTALTIAKGGVYKDIVNVVMKHSFSLCANIYGRNIIQWLNKKHMHR